MVDARDLGEEAEDEILESTGMAWTPLDKECVHTQLYKAQELKISFTPAYKQQIELIEQWVKEEEKRLPPMPPKSPFE